MLHIIWSIIIGFIVGWIARAIMPGVDHYGFWVTAVIGIVGSLLGGLIGSLIRRPTTGSMIHPAGFVMSIVGALIVIWAVQHFHLIQ